MPPRFAYWTIIVEGKPTAFRAQLREELIPTFKQLQSKHPDAVMMWFARGRLWTSPEESRAAEQRGGAERRKPDWRPGGEHKDPRARFDIPRDVKRRRFAERMHRDAREPSGEPESQGPEWRPKPDRRPPRQDRPGGNRPWLAKKPEWKPKSPGGPGDRRPGSSDPANRGERRPFENRGNRPPRDDRGPRPPRQDENRGDRPWRPKKPDWKPKPPGERGPKFGGGGQGKPPSGFKPKGPGGPGGRGPASRGPGNRGPAGPPRGRGPGGKPPGGRGRGGGGGAR